MVQGKPSAYVVPVGVSFESLDRKWQCIKFRRNRGSTRDPIYEINCTTRNYCHLHNHWLYMNPLIMYIHIQSVEHPLHFARKLANSFLSLSDYPVTNIEGQ